jgi:glycosyltransferase involved in cell wall biosynthesis
LSSQGIVRVAYVLRRYPRLSQSFVLNEMRALEASEASVVVLGLEQPHCSESSLSEAVTADDRRRPVETFDAVPIRVVVAALFWAMRHHPLRLTRLIFTLTIMGSRIHWAFLGKALVMARHLARTRIEHLHAHLYHGSEAAWLVHRLTGKGYSFTAHARDIYVRGENLPRRLADAAFTVTVCDYNRTKLAALCPQAADRIHVIHPFLHPSLLTHEWASSAPHAGPLRLICVCRLVPKKGVHVLIDSIAHLRHRNISVQLEIIGDGKKRNDLAEQIGRLGLSEEVFLTGSLGPAAVRDALASSHCFALASVEAPDGDSDATPTVLGEAMAMGLPVISTTIAGIPEIVPEGAGFLVPPGDPESLADAIERIARMSPAARQAMGTLGRAFVLDRWNPASGAERLKALFSQALTTKPCRPRRSGD